MRGSGWPMLSFGSGAARFVSNLQAGGLMQRTDQRALAKLDLELVVLVGLRPCERLLRGDGRSLFVDGLALQHGFRLARAPGNGGNAAERDPRLPHGAAVDVERHSRRGERELVGLAVADFQKQRAAGKWRCRNAKRSNQLARSQRGLV